MYITCIKYGLLFLIDAFRYSFQLLRGVCWIARLRTPIISVFGGAEAHEESEEYQKAFAFAERVARAGMSVITGGGPGIMQAANCGARAQKHKNKKKLNTLGIAVKGVDNHIETQCAPLIWVSTFFLRKWLLTCQSSAVVVFPGGVGTADELFETLNLFKHGRLSRMPIVLVNSAYWSPIIDWMKEQALPAGYIQETYLQFFTLVDTADEAFEAIRHVK